MSIASEVIIVPLFRQCPAFLAVCPSLLHCQVGTYVCYAVRRHIVAVVSSHGTETVTLASSTTCAFCFDLEAFSFRPHQLYSNILYVYTADEGPRSQNISFHCLLPTTLLLKSQHQDFTNEPL